MNTKAIISCLVAVLIVAAFGFAAATLIQQNRISRIQKIIAAKYATDIERLEHELQRVSRPEYDADMDMFNWSRRLQPNFDKPEVFAAFCSLDGHHGSWTIKSMPDGFTTYPWLSSSDASGNHRLYYGRSFGGVALYVLEGWVPSAEVVRNYRIAFVADKIADVDYFPRPAR